MSDTARPSTCLSPDIFAIFSTKEKKTSYEVDRCPESCVPTASVIYCGLIPSYTVVVDDYNSNDPVSLSF